MHSADQPRPRITARPFNGVEICFRGARQMRYIRLERRNHSEEFIDLLCRIVVGWHRAVSNRSEAARGTPPKCLQPMRSRIAPLQPLPDAHPPRTRANAL